MYNNNSIPQYTINSLKLRIALLRTLECPKLSMMSCGVGADTTISAWLSFIGLGTEEQKESNNTQTDDSDNTDDDDDDCDDDTVYAETSYSVIGTNLTKYAHCMPVVVKGSTKKRNMTTKKKKEYFRRRCTPTTCRMTSGMCVDCANCLDHCICGDENINIRSSNTNNSLLLLGNDNSSSSSNRIMFSPPSLSTTPIPHRSSIKIKQVEPISTLTSTKKTILGNGVSLKNQKLSLGLPRLSNDKHHDKGDTYIDSDKIQIFRDINTTTISNDTIVNNRIVAIGRKKYVITDDDNNDNVNDDAAEHNNSVNNSVQEFSSYQYSCDYDDGVNDFNTPSITSRSESNSTTDDIYAEIVVSNEKTRSTASTMSPISFASNNSIPYL